MSGVIRQIQKFAELFTRVTTAIVIFAMLYIMFFKAEVGAEILWQLLITSALTSAGYLVCVPDEEISKKSMKVRTAFYFLYVNVVVLICSYIFGWVDFSDMKMLAGMELTIISVFAVVCTATYYLDLKVSKEINRRLKEREL